MNAAEAYKLVNQEPYAFKLIRAACQEGKTSISVDISRISIGIDEDQLRKLGYQAHRETGWDDVMLHISWDHAKGAQT